MKLIIDRQKWLRGEGSAASSLLRAADQKQCCIGIYLEQTGINRAMLNGRKAFKSYVSSKYGHVNVLPTTSETGWLHDNEIVVPLYQINDNVNLNDAEREAELTTRFAAQGVEVEFIN